MPSAGLFHASRHPLDLSSTLVEKTHSGILAAQTPLKQVHGKAPCPFVFMTHRCRIFPAFDALSFNATI
jgi:hypothetical protein